MFTTARWIAIAIVATIITTVGYHFIDRTEKIGAAKVTQAIIEESAKVTSQVDVIKTTVSNEITTEATATKEDIVPIVDKIDKLVTKRLSKPTVAKAHKLTRISKTLPKVNKPTPVSDPVELTLAWKAYCLATTCNKEA